MTIEQIVSDLNTKAVEPAQAVKTFWASENILKDSLRDNISCVLTTTKCAANTVPLYTAPQAIDDETKRMVLELCRLIIDKAGPDSMITRAMAQKAEKISERQDLCGWSFEMGVAFAEKSHGITGGSMMVADKWQAECASGRGIVQEWFVRVDGDDIAIASDIRDRKGNYSEPNAKLIAAAPEMALLIREAVNKGIFQGAMHMDAISILSRLTIFHGGEHDTSR